MPRRTPPRTPPGPEPPAAGPSALTDDQVSRWADLIAEGRDVLPEGLPPADRERLAAGVRPRLRARMVHLIARAVAARLRRPARRGEP